LAAAEAMVVNDMQLEQEEKEKGKDLAVPDDKEKTPGQKKTVVPEKK